MSTVSVVVRVLPLAVALVFAAWLARSAVSRWSEQRSSRAYELPEDYRPAARRAVAAGAVFVAGIVVTAALPALPGLSGLPGGGPRTWAAAAEKAAEGSPAQAPPGAAAHGDGDSRDHGRVAAHGDGPHVRAGHAVGRTGAAGSGRPASPATKPSTASSGASTSPSTSASGAASANRPRTIDLPAGGSLQLLADGTRVWLPPQYVYPTSADLAFPVVVAYLPLVAAESEETYPAFVRQVASGKADPFVVVQPPDCSGDPLAAVAEAARYYRLLDGAAARGVLGVGPLAPCAVRAALRHPEVFGAYVGVSGTYGRAAVRLPGAPPSVAPNLLLTDAYGELSARRSAYALRTTLRGVGMRARIIDTLRPDPSLGGGGRRRELAVAAQYLTEQLEGPARRSTR